MKWDLIIGTIGSIASIGTVVVALMNRIIIKRIENKSFAKVYEDLCKNPGNRPAFLIIDIGENSIRNQIENWLRGHDDFKAWLDEGKASIHHLDVNNKDVAIGEVGKILDKVRKVRGDILDKGADRIYLFYRGPVAIALMVGAEFSNGFPVLIYQNDRKIGGYEFWGPLQ